MFYATTFDRDRALMRLQDNAGDTMSNDNTERVAPRLDRRRVSKVLLSSFLPLSVNFKKKKENFVDKSEFFSFTGLVFALK